MRMGILGVAKVVSVCTSPHPPYAPPTKARCLSFAEGVALHTWSLSLQDKEERIPGIREDWIRV